MTVGQRPDTIPAMFQRPKSAVLAAALGFLVALPLICVVVLHGLLLSVGPVDHAAEAYNAAFKPEITALKPLPSVPAPSIQFWDGAATAMSRQTYYRISPPGFQPEKLVVPGLDEIVSLGGTAAMPAALGKTGGALLFLQKESGEWKSRPLPMELLHARNPKLIPSTEGVAVLAEAPRNRHPPGQATLHRYTGGQWSSVPLPAQPNFAINIFRGLGYMQFLYGSKVFAAWDLTGSGALRFVSLDKPGEGWVLVNGKNTSDHAGISGFAPITGMTVDGQGDLYVSEGVHYNWLRSLYRYDGQQWEAVVHSDHDQADSGKVSFLGEKTDVVDVFGAPDGKLYVLGGRLGIFT